MSCKRLFSSGLMENLSHLQGGPGAAGLTKQFYEPDLRSGFTSSLLDVFTARSIITSETELR